MTAAAAASDNFLRRSSASRSLLALVFELPLGATPLRILLASCGVKLTNETSLESVLFEDIDDTRDAELSEGTLEEARLEAVPFLVIVGRDTDRCLVDGVRFEE